MKAVILAAGRGSRMKGLTDEKPKCLNELLGRPLFDWQQESLREAGITDIVVGRGYRKELLTGDFQTADNDRWDQTNMVYTLLCAAPYLRADTCVVSYADIVYHPDHVRALMAAAGDVVITYDTLWRPLWELRFPDPLADAETLRIDERGIIQEIGQKAASLEEIQGQYMGLLKFTPQGWGQVEELLNQMPPADLDRLDMTSLLQKVIRRGIPINTVGVKGRWCEIDSETDLDVCTKHANTDQWEHDWRWE
ncbi:MAG: phosphocholine cytidylyltransferase family protein [Candidatus Omnitrophica bacterium]|nr:phosphocholine cytidylyltransferase family protein [Candidatus Omnitrophota bacterium]